MLSFLKALFGTDGRAHLIPFEAQHARECLRHTLIVIDDQDLRGGSVSTDRWHVGYCNLRLLNSIARALRKSLTNSC